MVRAQREKKRRSRVAAEILEGLTELEAAVRSGEPLESRFTVWTVRPIGNAVAKGTMNSGHRKGIER